ncbi:MAG TPA: 50S ribosomal protein L25 [Acidimicrobiia bacterium]|jgi:large subunit ribosomal protein L25|nr:50S ribosomal protein L25 [Acidimicrobiia bacterium]
MAEEVILTAEPRVERGSRPAGRLRRAGVVPAVIYGRGGDTVSVSVGSRDVTHILARGANTLITLRLDGDDQLTLARQVQRHPTRGDILHVDFIRVSTDVAVSAEVPLHLLGEPEGVRSGGLLEQLVFGLPIEARPQDIPSEIEADVSALEIGDQIRLSDLSLPSGVTPTIEPDALIAQVVAPRVTAEEEAAEAAEGEAAEGAEGAEEGAGEAPAASETSADEGGGE